MCSQEGLLDLRNEKYVVSFLLFFFLLNFFSFTFFLYCNQKKMLHNTELLLYLLSQVLPAPAIILSWSICPQGGNTSIYHLNGRLPLQVVSTPSLELPKQRPDSNTWRFILQNMNEEHCKDSSDFRTYDSVTIWDFFLNTMQNHMTFSIACNRELVQIGFKVGRGGFIASCKVRQLNSSAQSLQYIFPISWHHLSSAGFCLTWTPPLIGKNYQSVPGLHSLTSLSLFPTP